MPISKYSLAFYSLSRDFQLFTSNVRKYWLIGSLNKKKPVKSNVYFLLNYFKVFSKYPSNILQLNHRSLMITIDDYFSDIKNLYLQKPRENFSAFLHNRWTFHSCEITSRRNPFFSHSRKIDYCN